MDPLTILAVINGSLALTESLLPVLDQLVKSGQITAEQQAVILAKYNSLKARADGQFSGPQWAISAG